MSVEIWKIEKNLCRCCHSDGAFDNLAEPKQNLDQEEIYSNMLKECFNIEIIPVPGELCAVTYTICKACISRLQDATSFKKQVLDCEGRFMDLYLNNTIKVTNSEKESIIKEEDLDSEAEFKESFISLADGNDEDYDIKQDEDDPDSDELNITLKNRKAKVKTKEKTRSRQRTKHDTKKTKNMETKEKKGEATFKLQAKDYKWDGKIICCCHCGKTYGKMSSLRFHVKTKHYKIPKYRCPECLEEFMTVPQFTVHKLESHNIDHRLHCNACKGIFNSKVQLKKHINNFHMMGEKFRCDFCDYESFSFEGLYKHKFKHKTVKDYHCRFCKKSFLRKTTLDLHERIHTGDRRKVCKVCGQAFVQKASLNYHMTKYHPGVKF
ncbi:unnamed protein product [Danaus chrysippus]|uniref:(African queen) hypothetical protein n=1 Tax=Danaus chrysippus TaxID=151541 RepID=A0A8J2QX41_9NEOP|nr:unnamed protein product [Danaus chrysippus]